MFWRTLHIGVICCFLISAVNGIQNNDTTSIEIPESYLELAKGNTLWYGLLKNCKNASMSCIKNISYQYLSNLLEYPNTYQITDNIKLEKNNLSYTTIATSSVNNVTTNHEEEKEEEGEGESGRSISPIEEMTSALHEKAVKFFMTHDIVLKLPEYFFEGKVLKMSPRTLDKDGAIINLSTFPGEGRIFFKKIKNWIGNKLVVALLAILLVIKLIAVKLLFFLPMIMGVAAAKKLLLKVLLFFFPILSNLFKLCPYYAPTKYHHHQHSIKHIHHLTHPSHSSHPPSSHHPVELDHPPHQEHHGYHYDDHGLDYFSEGPGVSGYDYHRKDDHKLQKPSQDIFSWFGGQGQQSKRTTTKQGYFSKRLTASEIENMIRKAEKEATLKVRLQEEQKRVEAENKKLQDEIQQLFKMQEKLKLQETILKQNSKLTGTTILHNTNIIPSEHISRPASYVSASHIIQPALLQSLPIYEATYYQNSSPSSSSNKKHISEEQLAQASDVQPVYDAFYSPILEKIDNILNGIGYTEEPCRERLICSMYKNPSKFSPHSNLLSAELSRDANDLEKPTNSNTAVVRFYKYVQAARDGQDNRDCIRLYPTCVINTET